MSESVETRFEPVILAFTCNWCSYRAADLAGTARIKYPPNVRLVRLMCSGRLDPAFVLKAQADLHGRLTRLFTPYADLLAVDPSTAAIAMRSLIFGAHRPELGMTPSLTPDQIADLLLGGVLARKDT